MSLDREVTTFRARLEPPEPEARMAITSIVAQSAVNSPQVLLFAVVLFVMVGGGVLELVRRRRWAAGFDRLLARDPSLRRTERPCGLGGDALAGMAATPRGDRRFGLRYGVSGTTDLAIDGDPVTLEYAAFQWWYEERRQTSRPRAAAGPAGATFHGRRNRYVKRTDVVAMMRLPHVVADDLRLTPESLLGRFGLTRGGHQLESSEFNRRFRVDAADRRLAVQLLDAGLQHRLTEEFAGRTVQLRGPVLAIGGRPSHRDGSLPGVIGDLPAVLQDVRRLVAAVPPQFWRAVATPMQG